MNFRRLVAVALLPLALAGFSGCAYNDPGTMTGCVVTDKDRSTKVVDGNSESVYRVYTENCDVLEVSDFWGHYDSATRFNGIKVGKTYDFDTRGIRDARWSMFPNIVTAYEVA